MLDRAPDGPVFIGLCFLVRAIDAIGFSAAMTASFSLLAKAFPNNIATALVSMKPLAVRITYVTLNIATTNAVVSIRVVIYLFCKVIVYVNSIRHEGLDPP